MNVTPAAGRGAPVILRGKGGTVSFIPMFTAVRSTAHCRSDRRCICLSVVHGRLYRVPHFCIPVELIFLRLAALVYSFCFFFFKHCSLLILIPLFVQSHLDVFCVTCCKKRGLAKPERAHQSKSVLDVGVKYCAEVHRSGCELHGDMQGL